MKFKYCFLILSIGLSGIVFSAKAQKVVVSPDPERTELFKKGSIAFLDGQYNRAALYYSALLRREKADSTLTKEYWYVLIDNLGMAYGIPGNLDSAEAVFRYGIEKDPTYPLFYYNMGCASGERGDMDKVIGYLRTAYKYKDNMIKGETFPDPMIDDSFKKFVNNAVFIKAVEEMKRGAK